MGKPNLKTGDSYDDHNAEPIKDSFDKIQNALNEIYDANNVIGSISFNRPSGSWHNTPDDPIVDDITVTIVNNGDDPQTGENNDSREANTVGVWYKTADSGIISDFASSIQGFSGQILYSNDVPNDKVCLVWLTYYKLANIIVASLATFKVDYVPNDLPVITLIGAANVNSILGDPYIDAGATAVDTEDGNITGSIVVGGDTVDINTIGAYVITFNVQDSSGANAIQVTRTVNVVAAGGETSAVLVVESPVILEVNP